MDSKARRWQRILTIISQNRFVTMQSLADEFCVSRRTIYSDIMSLSCDYPIYTEIGREIGGVYAMDGWYYNDQMSSSDTAFLKSLIPKLDPYERERLEKIIKIYGRQGNG